MENKVFDLSRLTVFKKKNIQKVPYFIPLLSSSDFIHLTAVFLLAVHKC